MTHTEWLRYFLFIAVMFLAPFFLGLLIAFYAGSPRAEIYSDETIIPLPSPIKDVMDAYEFANNRIRESGIYDARLTSIEITFANESAVKEQRGSLIYWYTININGRPNSQTAHGRIVFDMKHNTSTSLDIFTQESSHSWPVRWRNVTPLDFSKWTLTLDEVFEIIYEESGAYIISGIRIWCESDYWLISVSYLEPVNNSRIFIDPITKETWLCHDFCFVNCYSGCS